MTREELYAKLDRLFDNLDALKDRAEDRLSTAALGAEVAADQAKRVACRGLGWLRGQITDLELDLGDMKEKLAAARAAGDRISAERYTKAMEKYAEDMLAIAQEAADEAADAVAEAVEARRDFQEKFGE